MTYSEVIEALEKVKESFKWDALEKKAAGELPTTKGGYYRVGDVAIKIAKITELP
jgi:hypothetical protein